MGKKMKKFKRKLRRAGKIAKEISIKSAEWEKKLPSAAEIVGLDATKLTEMPSVAKVLGFEELTGKKKRE